MGQFRDLLSDKELSTQTFGEWLLLTEAGKNAVKVKFKKSKHRWEATFEVKDIEYNIEAYTNDDLDVDFEIREFKFYKDKSTAEITGDFKTHFALVPTIIAAFDEFVKEKKPDCVLFLAVDSSKSRKSLYKVNSDSVASKYDYYSINPMLPKNNMLFGICKEKRMIDDVKNLMGFEYIVRN